MTQLVLLRHGQSIWNQENLFTGWVDVNLSDTGEAEATAAGELLRTAGLLPDTVYTSVLLRSIRTAHLALRAADSEISVTKDWRLNERHYGALQGMNKVEAVEKFGEEQVKIWRRSFDVAPPPLDNEEWVALTKDPLYADVTNDLLPRSECLKDVVKRVSPFFESLLQSSANDGVVWLVAHGNSLRAIAKQLEAISDDDIVNLELPTGVPRVYEIGENLKVESIKELGDPATIAASRNATANQIKQK